MTPEEWRNTNDYPAMLAALAKAGQLDEPHLRALALACCDVVRGRLPEDHKQLVDDAKCYHAGMIDRNALVTTHQTVLETCSPDFIEPPFIYAPPDALPEQLAFLVGSAYEIQLADVQGCLRDMSEDPSLNGPQLIADIIRDVFPCPGQPIVFDANWRTSTALGIVRQMRNIEDFSAMPILADALQDAGCENEQLLAHCRGNGVNTSQSWVLRLLEPVEAGRAI